MSLHVDTRGRVNASIKRKEKQFRRRETNGLPNYGALKKEDNKSTKLPKLLRRGSMARATQATPGKGLVRYPKFSLMNVIMKTTTNHRLVTKA